MLDRVIGQYRITGVLGRGGMGAVYAAEHTLLGRPAAVKVLLPELSRNQEIVTRFFNEACAAAAVQHPGIVEIYDFGWTPEGAAFIVMEQLRGESLRARRRKQLAWSAALAMTRQIAGALGAAHARGIIHRDLKPDNIHLVPDPEVPGGERIKLLDFGIAKLSRAPAAHHTRTGAIMGTPTYMAPEQCRGVAVDSRADLYAVGVIFFELCAGRPPFVGEGEGDVLTAHVHVAPPALSSLAKDIPPEVDALVARMLAKAPDERVQTADELIRLIDQLIVAGGSLLASAPRAAPVVAVTPSPQHTGTTLSSGASSRDLAKQPPRKERRSRRPLVIALGLVAGAAIGGISALSVDDEPEAPRAVAITTSSEEPPPTAAASRPAEEAAPQPTPPPPPAKEAAPQPTPQPPPAKEAAPQPTPQPPPAKPASSPPPPTPVPAPPPPKPATAPPASLAAAPSTIDVAIDSIPPGADLTLDGVSRGKTPFHKTFLRADRQIKVMLRRAGYRDSTRVVSYGADVALRVSLTPRPPATPHDRVFPIQGVGAELAAQGVAAYAAKDYLEADRLFRAAYGPKRHPILLFNLAQVQRSLGNEERAALFYRGYLARDPNGSQADVAKATLELIE